ncbi:homoserine kinase [Aquifex pyrophilus]
MIKIAVPATTTNFGSGFDAFGLALDLKNIFYIEPSDKYEITVEGFSEGIPRDEDNLFIKVCKRVFEFLGEREVPIQLHQVNRVPPARGLGSSATAIVGAIEGALRVIGKSLSLEEKLRIAFEFEPHPDNILPAFVGGFTVCATNGKVIYKKLTFPEELKLIFFIPSYEVKTSDARNVLPKDVPLKDAVFNLQRSALFVTALITRDFALLREAVRDRLHQPYRKKLVKGFEDAVEISYELGSLATFLSGAGPTICSITQENEEIIKEKVRETIEKACGCEVETKILRASNEGVKVYG